MHKRSKWVTVYREPLDGYGRGEGEIGKGKERGEKVIVTLL